MNSFESWIKQHALDLSLQAEDLSWVHEFFPNIADVSVQISVGGQRYYGRGHSNSKEEALKIGIAEAIERAVASHSMKNSNGIAVHTEIEKAKNNARHELLERDLFLSHFRTLTPFCFCSEGLHHVPKKVQDYVNSNGDVISIYKTKETNLGRGYLCIISNGYAWGGVIGLSFGKRNEGALITKAVLESLRQYWHLKETNQLWSQLGLNDFYSLKRWKFIDHGSLALNCEYFEKIKGLFPKIGDSTPLTHEIYFSKDEFTYQVLNMDIFPDCPLIAVRCCSPYAQELSVGPKCVANIDGLNRFCADKSFQLNPLPHPLN